MKLLKTLFIQRFSVLDVLIFSTIVASGLLWWVMIITITIWSAISAFAENVLDIRRLNGNSHWYEL